MKIFLFGTIIGAIVLTVSAQNNPALSQQDAVRQRNQAEAAMRSLVPGDKMPSLYEEENEDVGPQTILRKRKHHWLRFSADEQVYFTDNMFFESDDAARFAGRDEPFETGVSVATLEGAIQMPPCITRFASYRAEVGYRHQFFDYLGNDDSLLPGGFVETLRRQDYDFDSSTAFAELKAQTAHYQFRFGFDYTRLLSEETVHVGNDDYSEFYREFVPRWSVQRNFRVCDRSQFSVAYLGSYHFTDEDAVLVRIPGGSFRFRRGFEDRSERWEHAAIVAYSVALPANFVVQPYYRLQFTDYTSLPLNNELSEYLHTAGLGIGWYPCANFSARLFANYNWNDSDSAFREYEQLNAGGGVNLTLRF